MFDNEKYKRYLQSDKWHWIANKRMEIDGYCCTACGCRGTTNNPLEVHHLSYKNLYHEETRIYEDLVTLCHVCHKQLHNIMNRTTSNTGRRGWSNNTTIPQVHVFNVSGTELEHMEVQAND